MRLALIPSSFGEFAIAAGAIAVGWFLVLLGNVLFGMRAEGGKRLLVFGFGCGMATLAVFVCRHFWPDFIAQHYPQALAIYLGAAFFVLGVVFLGASVFSSNQTVRSYFDAVLRSV